MGETDAPGGAPASEERRKLVLCGFFGRGNAGDEAFLHVQHRLFSEHFDIAVVVEPSAAHGDFASWEPYNQCEIWRFDEVNKIYDASVYGLHVGGGSLPFAYAGHYILSALDARKKVVMSGIDAAIKPKARENDVRREIYGRVDYLSVRTRKSFKSLKKAGVKVSRGADWALGLHTAPTDAGPVDVVVTMRGFSQPNEDHTRARAALEDHLASKGRSISWLPFAPEDRDFLQFTGVPDDRILNMWHDPRQVLDVISRASLVISIGRLHTLIFALIAETPCLAIDPGIVHDGRAIPNRKNRYFCAQTGLEFFDSIGSFIEQDVDLSEARFPARGFSRDDATRYDKMIADIRKKLKLP